MLLIEYVDHVGLRSLTGGYLGRHLEYFKTLNDARVASVGIIKYNASAIRINKEKTFKIKLQVILVFNRTIQSNTPVSHLGYLATPQDNFSWVPNCSLGPPGWETKVSSKKFWFGLCEIAWFLCQPIANLRRGVCL